MWEKIGDVECESHRSVGVQVATHVLNLELELALAALLGSLQRLLDCVFRIDDDSMAVVVYLEGKVLEEVSSAVGLVGLCAAAGIDPNTDGRGLGVGRVLGGNGEAVAEGGALSLCAVADGGSETAEARQRAILDGIDGGAAARGMLQVQCEPTGSHSRGHCWRRGYRRRWGERGCVVMVAVAGCCCVLV
jgi:hypothetical protein